MPKFPPECPVSRSFAGCPPAAPLLTPPPNPCSRLRSPAPNQNLPPPVSPRPSPPIPRVRLILFIPHHRFLRKIQPVQQSFRQALFLRGRLAPVCRLRKDLRHLKQVLHRRQLSLLPLVNHRLRHRRGCRIHHLRDIFPHLCWIKRLSCALLVFFFFAAFFAVDLPFAFFLIMAPTLLPLIFNLLP